MKSSKDNKGKGRKQSKGDRGSLEPTALFPRLHVKETKNGGPRAPPRNKMALYEQLTIPAHRFVHPTANPEAASSMTTTLAYPPQRPYNGGLAVPMYMAPPMPISTMSTGNHPLGPPMATQTSSNAVDCKAGCQTVSSLSHHAGRSMISLGEVSSLATSVNVRGANVSSSAGRADEDFTVPTFSSDKVSESALTGCCLTKEYLSRHQLPEQTVSGGTYSANSTLDLAISGDFETLQSQSHSGYGKGLFLKSSKASKKSGQEEKNGARDDEIVSKDCGLIGKANKWQSPKIQSYSSKQTQWHDADNSGSSHGYKSQHTMLETLANHKFNGKEGPAPGDIPVVARQNNLEASSKASRNLQGSGEVFNAKRQLNVSGFGGNTRDVATLLNVREAEIFHPYFNNSAEGTEDVENQTDGSGVEPSQPGGGETSDDSGSSMVDSSPASKVQPKDIIGAVGQHEFWKMRKAILKQQRIFAMQLFELHRLVKVQEMMADSPTLRIEGISDCPSARTLAVKDLKSLGTPEHPAAKDDQKEADCQKDDSLRMPAVLQVSSLPETAHQSSLRMPAVLQVSSLPETAHLSSPLSGNAQDINYETQFGVYAAPFSFPIVSGQDNAWGYAPQPNANVNQWVGSITPGSVAYGYQPYRPFPPFSAPLGAYNRPYSPIIGIPSPFEVPPIGYQQQLHMHSAGLDGVIPALPPYVPPFVDLGRKDGSDAKDYVNHSAMSRTPPTVIGKSGQFCSSTLACELSSEMLDTTATDASRWNGNQFCFQQVEHYAPLLGCQQPPYYSPRGFFPVLPPNHVDQRVQLSWFRGPPAANISNLEISSSDKPAEPVENMEIEQDKLFKRPREGSHAGGIIQHEGKPEKGTSVIISRVASDITQNCLPTSPWGSAFHAFNYRRPGMSDGHHEQVIKAVPRAMVATPESAAEILHSIQQERQ